MTGEAARANSSPSDVDRNVDRLGAIPEAQHRSEDKMPDKARR